MELFFNMPDWIKLVTAIVFGAGVFYGTNVLSLRELKTWMRQFEERLQTVEKSCVISQEREATASKQLDGIARSIDHLQNNLGVLQGMMQTTMNKK